MRKIINQILIFCSFFAVPVVLFSVPEEFVYKNIESLKPVQLDLRLQNEEAVRAQQSMIPRSKISLLPSDVKLKKQDVALKGVSKMPADDLKSQIQDEISRRSIGKELARNIERMKAIVPDRQAGYAADKAKKAAEKKPVLKGSPLSKGVKPLPAESSKSKEEKVQHAEPSKSKAKENDGLDSLINSTEEYFASISPEDADKMVQASLKDMSEEEKEEQLNFFLDAQKPK